MESTLRSLLEFRRRHSFAFALGLAAAGMLANCVPLRLFFQVDFLFGSVATLLVCRLHGPWIALLAGAVASLPTLWLWGHPYAVAIFALEGLIAGWLHRKRGHTLLVSDAAYWALAGMPLVLLFYRGAMSMPWDASLLVALKQGWNGISNALIANLLFLAGVRLARHGTARPPLFDWVFTGASLLVMGPVCVFLVLESHRALRQLEDRAESQVAAAVENASQRASDWYQRRSYALERLSEITAERLREPAFLQTECERIQRLAPDFVAVYIADTNATALAFAPRTNSAGASYIGSNFSHREDFRQIAATRKPVVSDIVPFGLFPGAYQTLSIPIFRGGEFAGYSCGVLNLEHLRDLLVSPRDGQAQVTLLDPKERVLASTAPALLALSDFSRHAPGSTNRLRPSLYLRTPELSGPEMMRWARSFYGWRARISDRWPLTAVAETPVEPVQNELHRAYINNFLVGFGSVGLAGLMAFSLTATLARPIKQLAAATSHPTLEDRKWPTFLTAELSALTDNFRAAFQALQDSMEKLRRHSDELSERNAVLSGEVARREKVEESLRLKERQLETQNEALLQAEVERSRYAENLEQQVIDRTVHLQESIRELEAFSYSVSHDLRAPLRAMAGYSDFLMEDYAGHLDDTAREYLKNIRVSAIRMDRLINDLLEYSRLSQAALPAHPVDPRPVLDRVLLTLGQEIADRGAEVIQPPSFPTVLANPTGLEQVLLNLIANALKFQPPGRAPRVTLRAEARDGHAVFSVADNGIGLKPEHRERIFGLFQRLHGPNEFEGTGVGLAIVRKALDRMNGRVWVDSEPGQGATFSFELPLA